MPSSFRSLPLHFHIHVLLWTVYLLVVLPLSFALSSFARSRPEGLRAVLLVLSCAPAVLLPAHLIHFVPRRFFRGAKRAGSAGSCRDNEHGGGADADTEHRSRAVNVCQGRVAGNEEGLKNGKRGDGCDDGVDGGVPWVRGKKVRLLMHVCIAAGWTGMFAACFDADAFEVRKARDLVEDYRRDDQRFVIKAANANGNDDISGEYYQRLVMDRNNVPIGREIVGSASVPEEHDNNNNNYHSKMVTSRARKRNGADPNDANEKRVFRWWIIVAALAWGPVISHAFRNIREWGVGKYGYEWQPHQPASEGLLSNVRGSDGPLLSSSSGASSSNDAVGDANANFNGNVSNGHGDSDNAPQINSANNGAGSINNKRSGSGARRTSLNPLLRPGGGSRKSMLFNSTKGTNCEGLAFADIPIPARLFFAVTSANFAYWLSATIAMLFLLENQAMLVMLIALAILFIFVLIESCVSLWSKPPAVDVSPIVVKYGI